MDQTFNINNWGLEKADRKLLTGMKYKIDALYGKFRKGKLMAIARILMDLLTWKCAYTKTYEYTEIFTCQASYWFCVSSFP